jgi:hypothetical protein
MNVVEYLSSLPKMRSVGKANESEITTAENELGLTFSDEYRDILKNLGAVRVCGHEINGFTKSPSLNVVEMTKLTRQNEKIPQDMYVFECLGIDDIVMLQNSKGEVYECIGTKITLIADSILTYLKSSIKY